MWTLPGRAPSADSISGICAMACCAVSPFRSRSRAVHPHVSTTTELMRESAPAFPDSSGHAETFRWTRTLRPAPAMCPPRDAENDRAGYQGPRQWHRQWPVRRGCGKPPAESGYHRGRVGAFERAVYPARRPRAGQNPRDESRPARARRRTEYGKPSRATVRGGDRIAMGTHHPGCCQWAAPAAMNTASATLNGASPERCRNANRATPTG